MYRLYYSPGSAALFPHMLMRELGAPVELVLVDQDKGDHLTPEFLALNPNGRYPVLIDGEVVLWESSAIAQYVLDAHPGNGLAPAPGDPLRPAYLKWTAYLASSVQPAYYPWFYPERLGGDAAETVKQNSARAMDAMSAVIEDGLGQGPWLLGDRFSALDLHLLMMTRWGRGMPNPPRNRPAVRAHAERVLARPAVAAAFAAEGLATPLI